MNWTEVERLALRWQETGDKRLLNELIKRLQPFTEQKIRRIFLGKGLENYLSLYGDEVYSLSLWVAWLSLRGWRQSKASLAHLLSLNVKGFATRLASKICLDNVSLFGPFEETPDGEALILEDVLPSDEPGPEEALMRREVQEALACLPERHQEVLRGRLQGETLAEIGARLGISRERVRQIEAKALLKLKKSRICHLAPKLCPKTLGSRELTAKGLVTLPHRGGNFPTYSPPERRGPGRSALEIKPLLRPVFPT